MTNEEACGLEMVRNWIPDLSEDVRRGRLRHYTYIIQEGEPEEDEAMCTEDNVPDVRQGRSDVQHESESRRNSRRQRRRTKPLISDRTRT